MHKLIHILKKRKIISQQVSILQCRSFLVFDFTLLSIFKRYVRGGGGGGEHWTRFQTYAVCPSAAFTNKVGLKPTCRQSGVNSCE